MLKSNRKILRTILLSCGLVAGSLSALTAPAQSAAPSEIPDVLAPPPASSAPDVPGLTIDNSRANPPLIRYESVDPLKLPPDKNLGEVLSVAVNSKGDILVLNHPGSANYGPLYGAATTELLLFDKQGNFKKEIGRGVYGLGYGHSVRYDKYDNLWVVDKGTDAVIKFDPQGKVLMNLGRRDEGYDSAVHIDRPKPSEAVPRVGWFHGPTDVAWDANDDIYISDGYTNSRVVKLDKYGTWLKSWGQFGLSGPHADKNPGKFWNPHSVQVDRSGNVYVADRINRRIQVFDGDGHFLRFILLNVPWNKKRPQTLEMYGFSQMLPDETLPWALCITNTTPQYLYAIDHEPGRIYKMTLEGKIIGMLGESGRQQGQFNWPHGIACPEENVLFIADMNNWRVQKLTLHPEPTK